MAGTDSKVSLIEAVEIFLADTTRQVHKLEYLVARNVELEEQLLEMTEDNKRLRNELLNRRAEVCSLIKETNILNKFQCEFMTTAGREFSSESKVVEMKYQVT